MAEPITVDNGALTDYAVLVDDVTDATLGTGAKQLVGIVDATIGGTGKVAADATNGLDVDVTRVQGSVTVAQATAASLNVTEASAAAIKTSVELIDDAVYTDGTGTPSKALGVAGTDGTNPQILKTDAAGELQIDVVTSALPTGAATLAEQQTQTTALQLIDDTVATDGSAAPTKGLMLAGTDGTNAQTVKVDTAGELQIDVLSIAAGNNNIGDVDVASIAAGSNTIGAVNVKPATSGGLTTHHLVSAATTNATVIKASAGQVFGWYIYNSNASARKIAFHNTASAPTAGASVFFSIVIPASSAANVEFTNGIVFSTGIAITMVTGLADTDATAVAANDLVSNIFYA